MSDTNNNATGKNGSRKNFLRLGVLALGAAVGFKFIAAKKSKPSTVKMLTQDGKLVEIDRELLTAAGKKISNDELKQWVTTRQEKH